MRNKNERAKAKIDNTIALLPTSAEELVALA